MEEDDELSSSNTRPIIGPPEFVRAAEMQRAYWTRDAEALSEFEARGVERLDWPELLRLHHLICLERLDPKVERVAATQRCRQSVHHLLRTDSPYRPRLAAVWQKRAAEPDVERDPDMMGLLLNPSFSHLGCLEVYRTDAAHQPTRIDCVGFGELAAVLFAPSGLIRSAKLFYKNGREEVVLVPLLYGLTWTIGKELDRAGRMTRFIAHIDSKDISPSWASGLGVGQQDLSIRNEDSSGHLFGLGSVSEIAFVPDPESR
jgi:hypothetical protein